MPSSRESTPTRRTGSQSPRIRIVPEYAYTYGPDAAELARTYAHELDPWEADVLDAWLAHDERGRPIAITCGLSVPRQNGKNYCIEIFELFCAAVLGWHILHTAHEVKTSMKAFRRVCSYFSGKTASTELKAMVKSIRRTNGQEAIELTNGGIIEFSARSRQAARGFDDVQVLVLDEAQEVMPEHMEALNAVLSASSTGTRIEVWTGTPTPPNSPGTVMASLREKAISGLLPRSVWHEWSVAEPPSATAPWPDVVDLVYETNPAMGIRLDDEFTAHEYAILTPDGFARERLGWWLTMSELSLISEEDWKACGTEHPVRTEHQLVAYGVKFAVDGSVVSLAAARRDRDNPAAPPHVALIKVGKGREGTAWLADWLNERRDRCAAVAIDGLYGRDVLVNSLGERRFPKKAIVIPTANDVATAASMLKERIDTRTVTWEACEGQKRLSDSVTMAERRDIGNRGAWGFGGEDPTPVEAVSLALFALATTKRRPGRRLRVG